jgi:hypothetical protein
MIDARGALVERDGARLRVVASGFVQQDEYSYLPGSVFNRTQQIWKLPANILGSPLNGAVSPRHKTPRGLALRPYQRRAVELLRAVPYGALLGLCTGAGKTVVALQTLLAEPALQRHPTLVTGPLPAAGAWVGPNGDPAKHYGMHFVQVDGTDIGKNTARWTAEQAQLGAINGIFINIEVLHAWVDWINTHLRPSYIVFDESDLLRNPKTRMAKAAKKIAAKRHVHKRAALTATPVVNHVIDLHQQLDIVQPNCWGDWVSFAKRYCGAVQNDYGWQIGPETRVEELRNRLDGALVNYSRAELSDQLPPFLRTAVRVPREALTQEPLEEYFQMVADLRGTLLDQGKTLQGAELQMVTRSLSLLSEAKRQVALTEAMKLCSEHYKVFVVCWYRETAAWLAKELGRRKHFVFGPITSKTTKKKRRDTLKALRDVPFDVLKESDRSAVFIATMKTCGRGMNDLVCCSGALVADLWYVPATLLQVEGRLHRPGQTKEVDWRYLVASETADDLIFEHLGQKAAAIAASVQDKSALSLCETLGGRNEEDDLKAMLAQLALVEGTGEL